MDPRSPYVLSTHDLGRQPGAMRRVERDVPAPADLGTAVVQVVPGSELRLELRIESVMEGVFVSGEARAQTHAECVRCLRDIDEELAVSLGELYFYPGARETAVAEGDEDAEEMHELEGELLDLEPLLRDAIVTAMPFQPLCEPDCAGLCPGCGDRLADLPADHAHEQLDPRWAALAALASQDGADSDGADGGDGADGADGGDVAASGGAR